MKKSFLLLASLAVLFASCQKEYKRPPLRPEITGEGTDYCYGYYNCFNAFDKEVAVFDITPYAVDETNHVILNPRTIRNDVPEPVTAELLWRETALSVGSVSIDNGKLTVSGLSGSGNAVVAIKGEDGDILWSYHVWKPLVNPEETDRYITLGADVMPINLGATERWDGAKNAKVTSARINNTAGLYYQWGRKDPMGRPDLKQKKFVATRMGDGATTVDWAKDTIGNKKITDPARSAFISEFTALNPEIETDILNGLANTYIIQRADSIIASYATKHPTTFIRSGSHCWFNTATTAGIYDASDKYEQKFTTQWASTRKYWYELKTCYDPCPDGYQVPPAKLWRGFLSSTATIVDEDGSSTSYTVASNDDINADAYTQKNMSKCFGYNFLYYGSVDTSKTAFFNAGGYRDAKGVMTDVQTSVRYLTYTTTDSYMRQLTFTSNSLSAQYGYTPSSVAGQVRCVKVQDFSDEDEQ